MCAQASVLLDLSEALISMSGLRTSSPRQSPRLQEFKQKQPRWGEAVWMDDVSAYTLMTASPDLHRHTTFPNVLLGKSAFFNLWTHYQMTFPALLIVGVSLDCVRGEGFFSVC